MKAVVFTVSSDLLASALQLPKSSRVLQASTDAVTGDVELVVTHPGLPDFGDEPRRCNPSTKFQWGFV